MAASGSNYNVALTHTSRQPCRSMLQCPDVLTRSVSKFIGVNEEDQTLKRLKKKLSVIQANVDTSHTK